MLWSRRTAADTQDALREELATDLERQLAQLRVGLEQQLRSELLGEFEARLQAVEARHAAELSALRLATLAELDADPEARRRALLHGLSEELALRAGAALEASRAAARATEALNAASREASAVGAALAPFTARSGARAAPERVALQQVQQARSLGLVFAWFDGGGTDVAEVRVGPTNPPQTVVGRINGRSRLNTAVAALVRPGEWWTVTSEVGPEDSGVTVIYTALA